MGRWILAAGLFLLVIFFVTSKTGFYTKLKLLTRKHTLEQSIVKAQEKQDNLKQKIDSLENDPDAIEKKAREEFGMGKEDEVIITFEKPE